ncbi:hypothetical protein PGT21_035451 [Puccinia graminis f. sp. tritici]|uniref:Uncharacterized protein n=1 Tax=Puccinia graminis f. sp. tritici TaxID=56615 RepID=A0A5B0NFS9_PUCGR|nr:hypothetical protein PGT21_035451 [Puccinia graminis f. sp. tritici]
MLNAKSTSLWVSFTICRSVTVSLSAGTQPTASFDPSTPKSRNLATTLSRIRPCESTDGLSILTACARIRSSTATSAWPWRDGALFWLQLELIDRYRDHVCVSALRPILAPSSGNSCSCSSLAWIFPLLAPSRIVIAVVIGLIGRPHSKLIERYHKNYLRSSSLPHDVTRSTNTAILRVIGSLSPLFHLLGTSVQEELEDFLSVESSKLLLMVSSVLVDDPSKKIKVQVATDLK